MFSQSGEGLSDRFDTQEEQSGQHNTVEDMELDGNDTEEKSDVAEGNINSIWNYRSEFDGLEHSSNQSQIFEDENESSTVEKLLEKTRKKVDEERKFLKLQTKTLERQRRWGIRRGINLVNRTALAAETTRIGGDPEDMQKQIALKNRMLGRIAHVFDLDITRFWKVSDDGKFLKDKKGNRILLRAPLKAIIAGDNDYMTEVMKQKVPAKFMTLEKIFDIKKTHKQCEVMKPFQVAAMKQAISFNLASTKALYQVHTTMMISKAFRKMEAPLGSYFSHMIGGLISENVKILEATAKALDNNKFSQKAGKRYLDLHPGMTSKHWYQDECGETMKKINEPTPHPQLAYNEWIQFLEKMGYNKKTDNPSGNQQNPAQRGRGRGGYRGRGRGRGNNRGRGRGRGDNGSFGNSDRGPYVVFWKRKEWWCPGCQTHHPRGKWCEWLLTRKNKRNTQERGSQMSVDTTGKNMGYNSENLSQKYGVGKNQPGNGITNQRDSATGTGKR